MKDKEIEQRIEFLEASLRSFQHTYAKLDVLLQGISRDFLELGDSISRIAEGVSFPNNPCCKLDGGKVARKISKRIDRTLHELSRYWLGDGDQM